MKYLAILGKQYSKLLIHEFAMSILVVFIVFSLMDALSPLFYTISFSRYITSAIPSGAIYYTPSDRIASLYYTGESVDRLEQQIDGLGGKIEVEGIGKTCTYTVGNTLLVGYNDDMIAHISMPLDSGTWLSEYEYEYGEVMPIVVGGAYRDIDGMQIGDYISVDYNLISGEIIDCVVVGILNQDDMYFSFSVGETELSAYSIGSLFKWEQTDSSWLGERVILFPSSGIENLLTFDYSLGRMFFFPVNQDYSDNTEIMDYLDQYGHSSTIPKMIKSFFLRRLYIYNSNFVTASSLFLFCVLGLGGYTILMQEKHGKTMRIYRICGMTKRRGTYLEIVSIALLIVVPACIAVTQSQARLDYFEILNVKVYMWFVLILLFILTPSILYCLHIRETHSLKRSRE